MEEDVNCYSKINENMEKDIEHYSPSEIDWKNSICYPQTLFAEDAVTSSGGRWTLFAFKELEVLDYRWNVLKELCDNGTLVAIKSSTGTHPEDCMTICYTSDSTDEKQVKRTADKIRKVTGYGYNLCYKKTDSSQGQEEIYLYVDTVKGYFYRKENSYLLPSEIDWKKRTFYYSKWVDKDALKEEGGKWVLRSDGDKNKLDQRWIVLKSLCDKGTLTGLESSTAADINCGLTTCFTSDSENKEDIRKAANEIRELIPYEYVMNYVCSKTSSSFRTGKYRISESPEICKYIHTVSNGFYEKDKYMRWIKK